MGVQMQVFLILALVWDEWLDSRPGLINPEETAHCINSIGGCVNTRACMDAVTLYSLAHKQLLYRLRSPDP
jgi:hypothetical protein